MSHTIKVFVKHCVTCKTIKDLMPKPYSKTKNKEGVVTSEGYMCRSCHRDRIRRYRSTPAGKSKTYETILNSINRNPERQKARFKVRAAVQSGDLLKPKNCSKCNLTVSVDAHHPDYTKPLDVIWLCRQCHAAHHYSLKN